jgi:hypothetical protein
MVINFIGQLRQALVYGEQAVSLLERAQEWYWLGRVHNWFAFIALRLGEFERALPSAARTEALGQTIGDRRLQCTVLRLGPLPLSSMISLDVPHA